MSLFSFFSNKPPEATSVAQALAGGTAPAKAKSRRSENRRESAEEQQLLPEKKRARRRLIGAVAIVLAVAIGLPMVLDSEPKPLNKNIVIQIPSRDEVSTIADTKEQAIPDNVAHPVAELPQQVLPDAPAVNSAPVETGKLPAVKAESREVKNINANTPAKKEPSKSKSETKGETRAATKPADKHVSNNDDSARAMAILGGVDTVANPASKPAGKIVIQVGAFSTQEKVKELQHRLSVAGIKSFTQKVATSSGDKIRVRIGPFADHESAAKTKTQLDKLGINGTLIPL